MNFRKLDVIKALMIIFLVGAALAGYSAANAAVWQDPFSGLYLGNICQSQLGWQIVSPAPIGSSCVSPAFGFGFVRG